MNMTTLKSALKVSTIAAGGLLAVIALQQMPGVGNTGLLPAAEAVDKKAWQRALGKHIGKNIIYPRSAIRKGIEGSARVRLTIDASGKILKHEVTEETGERALDRTIEKIVDRMNPLPTPPEGMVDGELSVVIPLTWRLR